MLNRYYTHKRLAVDLRYWHNHVRVPNPGSDDDPPMASTFSLPLTLLFGALDLALAVSGRAAARVGRRGLPAASFGGGAFDINVFVDANEEVLGIILGTGGERESDRETKAVGVGKTGESNESLEKGSDGDVSPSEGWRGVVEELLRAVASGGVREGGTGGGGISRESTQQMLNNIERCATR